MSPYDEAGPLYGMMLPILISVSVAPVSYFFWATALSQTATLKMAAADKAASRGRVMGMLVSLLLLLDAYRDATVPNANVDTKPMRVLALDQ